MRHLNTDPHFLAAAEKYGLATEGGAAQRIERAFGNLDESIRPLTFVMHVGGKFYPVAVMTDRNSYLFPIALRYNIYCTSA